MKCTVSGMFICEVDKKDRQAMLREAERQIREGEADLQLVMIESGGRKKRNDTKSRQW